jgi:hypothetical protein
MIWDVLQFHIFYMFDRTVLFSTFTCNCRLSTLKNRPVSFSLINPKGVISDL